MKSLRLGVVMFAAMWLASGAAAAAALTWTITGGTFNDGGTLSGTFTHDPLRPRPSTWNISVAGGGSAFIARTYTPANSNEAPFCSVRLYVNRCVQLAVNVSLPLLARLNRALASMSSPRTTVLAELM